MKVERTGIILYVKKYEACVTFYTEILALPILFQNDDLTSFDFFGSYLMVEKEDRPDYLETDLEVMNHSCIRLHVDNVFKISETMKKKGVLVDYQEHSWGTTAKFKDPEGNLIAFKDEASFAKQIEDFKS